MAASPVSFLFGFLIVSVTLWLIFIFASRVVAWILSRVLGASVSFRVGGWKCLRDVVVKLEKGGVESISIGEIRLSLRQSLAKLGASFISREPKLQILICDLEIILRSSVARSKKKKTSKNNNRKSGRGKWMVLVNIARFVSVSLTDLVVKTSKAMIEFKELNLDISKDGGAYSNLFVNLHIVPIIAYIGDPFALSEQSSNSRNIESSYHSETNSVASDKTFAPCICEEFLLICELAHNREVGVIIENLNVNIGDITLNLNEELVSKKKKKSDSSFSTEVPRNDDAIAVSSVKKHSGGTAFQKYIHIVPEKSCFTMPKLCVRFFHREHNLMIENNIMGIQLRTSKTKASEEVGESSRLDIQMECSEIHLIKEDDISIVEILKVHVSSFVYIPLQPMSLITAEVDVKLGGSQCKLILSRLSPWLKVLKGRNKKLVLRNEGPPPVKVKSSDSKSIVWTSTVSAPEMTLVVYNVNDSPQYYGCSQSLHMFANNVSAMGTTVHMELGELNVHPADEYQDCLKASPFSVDSNSGSLVHVAKVCVDWGKKESDAEEDGTNNNLVLSVDVTGMGVHLDLKRTEFFIATALSFQAFCKTFSSSKSKNTSADGRSSSRSSKGTQLIKFNLERCSVNFSGDTGLENIAVADPKRVNYGSQGGRDVISVCNDGSPRCAYVATTMPEDSKKVKYTISFDLFNLQFSSNKRKKSAEVQLERARSIYREYFHENKVEASVTLLDVHNSKLVKCTGGLKGVSVCSLFRATDIRLAWEPDVHLSLIELMMKIKLIIYNLKQQFVGNNAEQSLGMKHLPSETGSHHKHNKKETVYAIDVETLTIAGNVGDGVDAMVKIQSIFSENARIGVLLEGLLFSFNNCRVLKSGRMQISRIPHPSSTVSDAKTFSEVVWDWVIQGLDLQVTMPYRLELRAIDDSVEDMIRALKLIVAAKTQLLLPPKPSSAKPKKPGVSKLGYVRLCFRKVTVDIEEQPLQGWLDEHYRLMRNEACERTVRLDFLDKFIADNTTDVSCATDSSNGKKVIYDEKEVDINDQSTLLELREDIHMRSFRSYYKACQKLVPSEASSGLMEEFEAGIRPSMARTSLLSVSATDIDLTLTKIAGGESGMIQILKSLDVVCFERDIPFSRLYGSNLNLKAGKLIVQLRDYTHPLFSGTLAKCDGRVILAQQATSFQPQISQEVFVGRWRKVTMLRSASGTTPPIKTYFDLPLNFQKGEVSFGVGYEPSFADVSYAFTVALRRANLSIRNPGPLVQPPKKERSLPWWDDMRNYIHGKITLFFHESCTWNILATTDPYENQDKLQITSSYMEIQQSDGRVFVSAKDFKIFISSLDKLADRCGLKPPSGVAGAFLEAPAFSLEVLMDWECESGTPLNHYLHSLPVEGKPREKILDPFRSTSLSLRWNFSLRPDTPVENQAHGPSSESNVRHISPKLNVGAHDLAWALKFWSLNYLPPHKLRMFSRWRRFGVPRAVRSGNLSMDKVMTEFFFRIDSTPACIKHMSLHDDDPAKGLTFNMTKLKYELCWSRGKQKYTYDCKREPLDLVYQGLNLHMPKAVLEAEDVPSVAKAVQMTKKTPQSLANDKSLADRQNTSYSEKRTDDGFFLSCDYFSIRRQAPKADSSTLSAWRKNFELTYVRSEFENGSESDDNARSELSDDDGFNDSSADNCRRVLVSGLKLLWTIQNRDAVWSWVGGLSKAFEPSKPSPSRLYAQRKLMEESRSHLEDSKAAIETDNSQPSTTAANPPSNVSEIVEPSVSPSNSTKAEKPVAMDTIERIEDEEEEGTRHFMVNVIEPQFNLHSEEANGRFLLAAVSGRVLARSFHSVLRVGHEIIEQALGSQNVQLPECAPEMTWKRWELSVMLEQVQAHVAPTDVDPGAGLQWLPKIHRSSPRVKRTGALLERVFMPCDMYFRYTRHKGGTQDLKVKPLKELTFNSHNITATMTSRQFQVMLDVLTNLLFARLPKPRKSSLSYPAEDDDDIEEEADEVVPDGVEEVELAKVNLEHREREVKIILDDLKRLTMNSELSTEIPSIKEGDIWMLGGTSSLVGGLKKDFLTAKKHRKTASSALRMALQKAAHLRLMEKEKNKSPSYAMRISLQISKVVWSMLTDGKSFAEAEISDMIFDFDRDYKDVGVALFTTKSFIVRNCLPNAKSDMVLSPWNPPPDWGKKVMLRVDAKQAAPKDGISRIELFQVEIYPLKIYLTDAMYKMMWGYFFPEEEQDSQRRQEVWRITTTAGARRVKKSPANNEAPSIASRTSGGSSHSELRRTSSYDRNWEESIAESVAAELVLQAQSSRIEAPDHPDESSKSKSKESKALKPGRSSHEEKKVVKATEEKRPRKMMEFQNIKISQVELQLTYESSRFNLHELKLLMDTFHRVEFTGTWRRLFSRVKKHVVWGTLKSVTGMQGKKFKDKANSQEAAAPTVPDNDLINLSDQEAEPSSRGEQYPTFLKRPAEGAGDGFVTSIKGLFNTQRRKAKAFVLRTMRGEADNDFHSEMSEPELEFSPFARQLTITKAKRLIRRHTKKFRSRPHKGSTSQPRDSVPPSPRESFRYASDSSSGDSPYEDFHDHK